MRLILFITLSCYQLASAAQVETFYLGEVVFSQIMDGNGLSNEEIYTVANDWVAHTYAHPEKVVKLTRVNSFIGGTGFQANALVTSLSPRVTEGMVYTFRIEIMDGKCRFLIHEIKSAGKFGSPLEYYLIRKDGTERTSRQARQLKASALAVAEKLISSFQKELQKVH